MSCHNLFSGKNKKNIVIAFGKEIVKLQQQCLGVPSVKENLSNLLELASDGNCSLLFKEINQHLAS